MEVRERYPRKFIVIIEDDKDLRRFKEFMGEEKETPQKGKKSLESEYTEDYTTPDKGIPYPDVPFEISKEEDKKLPRACEGCGANTKIFPLTDHRGEERYLCYDCGLDEIEKKRKMKGVIEKETPEELLEFLEDNKGRKFTRAKLREEMNIPHRKLKENLSLLIASGQVVSNGTPSMENSRFWVSG